MRRMPRGYGLGGGRRRGYCGWGPDGLVQAANDLPPRLTMDDAVYVGPCRCGTGPRAFYRSRRGELIHASDLRFEGIGERHTDATVQALREENRTLSERIRHLEDMLRDEPGPKT